ncbi:MAG: mechanosensitive ion channel, partial [Gammaproteobacteria bacterium]|nr:mechanosensitive ion channel [Gammaproteobacteria bacterium]
GDLVTVHDEYGTISDITLGHTVITTWDNRRLIIPNHIISDEAIINWSISDPTILWPINIGIGYDSDIDLARSIMIEEAKDHAKVMGLTDLRKYHPEIVGGEEIRVSVTELGDFAVNLRLDIWVANRSKAFFIGCDLIESIKKRFDLEGIEIPYPYRTIVYKKDIMEN